SAVRTARIRPTISAGASTSGAIDPTTGTITDSDSSNRFRKVIASSAIGWRRSSSNPRTTQRHPASAGSRRMCIRVRFLPACRLQRRCVVATQSEDALEPRRVLRRDDLGRTRKVQVEQARQPETQGRRTQHRRPCVELRWLERTYAPIGVEHRVETRGVELRIVVDAPVVDGDREIEEPGLEAREPEVDDAGQLRGRRGRIEEDVVAE